MSVKRLVVEADVSVLNVKAFCAAHGISRWFFYDLRKRFAVEGESALENKSRANTGTVANKTATPMEDLIVRYRKELADAGLDAGPATIAWHLIGDGETGVPTESTIWRILTRRGFITPDPSKSPNKKWKRFQAERANELWQIDGTDWELAGGEPVKIINVIDDGSRQAVSSEAALSESFDAAFAAFLSGAGRFGLPERILHDNAKGFLKLDAAVMELGVATSRSRIYHPQTCGKVERFHQTLKKWLAEQQQPNTLGELQALLDTFTNIYNTTRPHRALPQRMPPSKRWNQLPKSGPADQPLAGPSRIYRNIVAKNGVCTGGQNCDISLGNKHAGKTVDIIITGTNAHVFAQRQTPTPTHHQPQPTKPTPTPTQRTTNMTTCKQCPATLVRNAPRHYILK